MQGFIEKSEFNVNGESVPCYAIRLTPEQAKLVENRQIDLLCIDGNTVFKVKNDQGQETGENVLFVIWSR